MHSEQTPISPRINLVIAPERGVGVSAPEPAEQPDAQKTEEKKSRRGLYVAVGSVAGVALAAGAVFGGIAASQPPRSQPTVETPAATPTPEAPVNTLTPEALALPSGLTPEQLGKTFVQDRLSTWRMAGGTKANEKLAIAAGSYKVFADELANKQGDLIADAILVPNWREVPALVKFVNAEKSINSESLQSYFNTVRYPEEPYNRWVTADSTKVVSQDSTSLVLATLATEFNNASKNRIGQIDPGSLTNNGAKMLVTATYVPVGASQRVSAIGYSAPQ